MTLAELLAGESAAGAGGFPPTPVSGLSHDSRAVREGEAFFALPGARTDGSLHALEAARRGACAVVSQSPAPAGWPGPPWVQVADASRAMASAAEAFFGRPSASLTVLGVTGTNGKTTTTYFAEAAASACGRTPGVVGTVEIRLAGRRLAASVNTTPVSLELARALAAFRDGGAQFAALEVSSHALALGRVEAVDFDAAVFLNLSRDHLDYHGTLEAYARAKARLFELLSRPSPKSPKAAALNADDPWHAAMLARVRGPRPVLFGFGPAARDLRGEIVDASPEGSRLRARWQGRTLETRLRLPGAHNAQNALAAAAPLLGLGYDPQAVFAGLGSLEAVPGRLERVSEGQDFHVFVDYAHTDAALATVLKLLGQLPHRRLFCVVGCGGERDRGKRGLMGAAACAGSDHAFLTSDNPRGEDPAAILSEVEAGARGAGLENYTILPDRAEAIAAAVAKAEAGDIVLLAGKGHETVQILREGPVPFDDREQARRALRARL